MYVFAIIIANTFTSKNKILNLIGIIIVIGALGFFYYSILVTIANYEDWESSN
jgi:hypothetical protein